MKILLSSYAYWGLILLVGLACQGTSNVTQEASPKRPTVVFKSMIRSMFQDAEGGYWIGSHKEGLAHIKDGVFRYYIKEDGLPSNQIRRIQTDRAGHIWLETAAGISEFDGKTFINHQAAKAYKVLGEEQVPINMMIGDNLWFGGGDANGALRWDGQELVRWRFPVPEHYPNYDENGHHPTYGYDPYAVYGLYQTPSGTIWLGTSGNGLYLFNGEELKWINEGDSLGVVRAIKPSSNGDIWFGNNALGIYRTAAEKKTSNFSEETRQKPDGLWGALAMETDPAGTLWFGTFGDGVWSVSLDSLTSDFTNLHRYTTLEGLQTDCVSSMLLNDRSQLLLGTCEGQVILYDGHRFSPFW
ncbi:MAG: two-component regulator propeller domain-containing protein [Bacteroidota bacterium]